MAMVFGSFLVSGCAPNTQAEETKVEEARAARKMQLRMITVYFATSEGYMVPVTYSFKAPVVKPERVAIEKLLEGPRSGSLVRTLPAGTRLKDCYISGDTALVDFSGNFCNFYDDKSCANGVKSLCLTLGTIPGVENVQILVDGKSIEEIHGVYMGEMLRHSWVNYSGKGNSGYKYEVYFADSSATYMVPITYTSAEKEGLLLTAAKRLVAGPEGEGLCATIWPGTKVLGLQVKDGLASINLSKEAVGYGGGSTAEGLFVKSLLLTLGQFEDIRKVQILIEGQKTELLPEGTLIGIPLEPPAYANYFDEAQ